MTTILVFQLPDDTPAPTVRAIAVTESGTELAYHRGASVDECKQVLGIGSQTNHEIYSHFCPDGFEIEWIEDPANDDRCSWHLSRKR